MGLRVEERPVVWHANKKNVLTNQHGRAVVVAQCDQMLEQVVAQ